jgi:hypothetical protein
MELKRNRIGIVAGLMTLAIFLTMTGMAMAGAIFPNTPYLSFADSPFNGVSFSYFFLETFEDHLLNVPGVTASPPTAGVTSVVFGASVHDSVDADDGVIDGSGLAGDSFFSGSGATGITFTFSAAVLGSLPTHAGIVWTDGSGTITFQAFDASNALLGTITCDTCPDASISGTTAEDRFFGWTDAGGISKIFISNSAGGIEVDHLQYGRLGAVTAPIPEPASLTLLGIGLAGLAVLRRMRKKI